MSTLTLQRARESTSTKRLPGHYTSQRCWQEQRHGLGLRYRRVCLRRAGAGARSQRLPETLARGCFRPSVAAATSRQGGQGWGGSGWVGMPAPRCSPSAVQLRLGVTPPRTVWLLPLGDGGCTGRRGELGSATARRRHASPAGNSVAASSASSAAAGTRCGRRGTTHPSLGATARAPSRGLPVISAGWMQSICDPARACAFKLSGLFGLSCHARVRDASVGEAR